jgi:microcystin-dependent protein
MNMRFQKVFLAVTLAVATLFVVSQISFASVVPLTLNYQGTLTDNLGKPVEGTLDITFKLYNVLTGGTPFWTETQTVTVTKGQFSVDLGSITPLNPSKFTGVTYVGIAVGTDPEMLQRQKLTSVAYALKAGDAGAVIPKGLISMWSGAVADIPTGWALCDGTNGAPDLRDRFIVGAGTGSGYAIGDTGGESTHILTPDEMPSHTHIQDAHNHGITDPGHYHQVTVKDHDGSSSRFRAGDTGTQVNTPANTGSTTTGIAVNNQTPTNQYTGGGLPHENRPPYYALAFIIKL